MAARGGRRQQSWTVPLSWREAMVLDAAHAIAAARLRPRLSRADWLLALAEPALQQAASASDLPPCLPASASGRSAPWLDCTRNELNSPPTLRGLVAPLSDGLLPPRRLPCPARRRNVGRRRS